MSWHSKKPKLPGAGLGTALALVSSMTLLYLGYRGAVSATELGTWMMLCVCGGYGLGFAGMMLLRSVLFHRWLDDKRAEKAVLRIDLIIMLVTVAILIVLGAGLRILMHSMHEH